MKKLLHALIRSATSVQKTSSLLFLVFIGFLSFGLSLNTCAQGPGSAWQYYRVITLNPATPSANFQVKITLVSGQYSNMNANGSDLRFYDNSDVNSPYWIEVWNNTGTSVIWVKVATSGATSLRMYYGNTAASAETNGASTFDFFDDFPGTSLGINWYSDASGGSISVSGGQVTLSNTNGGNVSISSAYTPASTAFLLETKHREPYYNRNRFYAATTLNGATPPGLLNIWNDYGYFYSGGGGAQNTAQCYWNGTFYTTLTRNTDYLTRWLLSDGSTYNWYTLTYSNNTIIDTRTTTYGTNIRYITIAVTEVSGTSTIVDWVRVRKYAANEPVAYILGEVGATTQMIAYSVSAIFTVPGCVSSITVEVWGGGGGGENAPNGDGGNGGGGGGYANSIITNASGSYDVIVGHGGSEESDGTASTFGTNLVVADYGRGGTGSGYGNGGSSNTGNFYTASGGRGGTGNGNNDVSGGGGGAGGPDGAGINGSDRSSSSTVGGNGGTGDNGLGGAGGTGGNNANGGSGGDDPLRGGGGGGGGDNGYSGGAGGFPGGGGGGGENNGGSGANGLVIITWTYATAPTFIVSKTDISCFNAGDGTITVTASGGSGGYQYRINGGSGWIGWQSSNVFQNLGPGTYTVEVKDSNGCVQTECN